MQSVLSAIRLFVKTGLTMFLFMALLTASPLMADSDGIMFGGNVSSIEGMKDGVGGHIGIRSISGDMSIDVSAVLRNNSSSRSALGYRLETTATRLYLQMSPKYNFLSIRGTANKVSLYIGGYVGALVMQSTKLSIKEYGYEVELYDVFSNTTAGYCFGITAIDKTASVSVGLENDMTGLFTNEPTKGTSFNFTIMYELPDDFLSKDK